MGNQMATPCKDWPKEIRVEPSRLEMGIWGRPEGDISAAYSADTFPKVRTFRHEGYLFTNCGGAAEHAMHCYPLIPESAYDGPEPKQFTYEGRECVYRGEKVKLGPGVTFVARERSPEEWVNCLRRQYAHGGYFASGKTYAEVLHYFAEQGMPSEAKKAAIENELRRTDLPASQDEMLKFLAGAFAREAADKGGSQLSLPGL